MDIAVAQQTILLYLAKGGAYVAQDISDAIYARTWSGYVWDMLRIMERSYLVCRASDYEDPGSYHKWKITGCGRLAALAPQS